MIKIDIPGRNIITIRSLVLDYNGTVAADGFLIDGVEERLARLKDKVDIYVLTADTYGRLLALADIITLSITDALDLLIYTDRIRATLRS